VSNTPGATVSVNGRPVEALPFSAEAEPGAYEVHVGAPGYVGETRSVQLTPGATVLVSVDLVPIAPETPPEEEEGFWSGPWPWIIGGSVLAVAGGITAGVLLWPEQGTASVWTLRVR
jgi:hypothetical protein